MMTRKSRGKNVNKGRCCAMFGWTRYKFDQNIAKGMPYVRAAAHKGDEWVVDTAEVGAWVEEQKRRVREYMRRSEERTRTMLRAMEERQEAARRAERERVARWEAESRAREEARLLDRAYRVCADLARADYGFPPGRPLVRDEHPEFARDWPPYRPDWWRPPPGLLEAIRAEPTYKPYDHREPDWRRWWPVPYEPGRPWPWRDDGQRSPTRPA
jgi:phage terminase Nu1 subunit (DNA packaging protein)